MPPLSGNLVSMILHEATRGKNVLSSLQDRLPSDDPASPTLTEIRLVLPRMEVLVVLPNGGIIKNSPGHLSTQPNIQTEGFKLLSTLKVRRPQPFL
jgi:hypothetical protein